MKFNRFALKHYPGNDFPENLDCFQFVENAELDENSVEEGQALIHIRYVSLDPLLRVWISGAKSYLDPVKPGSSIPGFGLAKVINIKRKKGKKTIVENGDWVVGMLEWSEYMIIDYKQIQKLPLDLGDEMYKFLTVYGPTGFTSYFSIKQQIQPFQILDQNSKQLKTKENLNIVISSVAGGIGLTLTEYLSKLGYKKLYGIAGTDKKCKVAQDLGCKATINYKNYYTNGVIDSQKFETDLKTMLNGQQIDIYYENVGEDILSSMLNLMANHSKIIMCGATATYFAWNNKAGISNYEKIITKRILVKGVIYFQEDFNARIIAFMEMGALEMKGADFIVRGIKKLPETYRGLIKGEFVGKPVVKFE